jgi:predicted nuclease of predicted toxin-antitoxin system
MDHHVHAAITEGLRRRGVDVITAHEDGAAAFEDERLLQRATQLGRVLFSQDKDLLILTHQWLQAGIEFSGVGIRAPAQRDLELIAKTLDL